LIGTYPPSGIVLLDNKSTGFSPENLRAETSSRKKLLVAWLSKERQVNVISSERNGSSERGVKTAAFALYKELTSVNSMGFGGFGLHLSKLS
jgi:hypothetical protein